MNLAVLSCGEHKGKSRLSRFNFRAAARVTVTSRRCVAIGAGVIWQKSLAGSGSGGIPQHSPVSLRIARVLCVPKIAERNNRGSLFRGRQLRPCRLAGLYSPGVTRAPSHRLFRPAMAEFHVADAFERGAECTRPQRRSLKTCVRNASLSTCAKQGPAGVCVTSRANADAITTNGISRNEL